jgi:hypothetical protein
MHAGTRSLPHARACACLCSAVLQRLNPLLGRAVALRDAAAVRASVAPVGGVWPAEELVITLGPMEVGSVLGDTHPFVITLFTL